MSYRVHVVVVLTKFAIKSVFLSIVTHYILIFSHTMKMSFESKYIFVILIKCKIQNGPGRTLLYILCYNWEYY
jgi:hypothetical protein